MFPLMVHRFGTWIDERWKAPQKNRIVRKTLHLFYQVGRLLSVIFWKIEIEEDAQIAGGVSLSPKGGIILGPKTMGAGCKIYHNVTIGYGFGSGKKMARPEIGQRVSIGPNAVIYGNVKIGGGAVICSDTVVNKNVPALTIVKGNPPRLIGKVKEKT